MDPSTPGELKDDANAILAWLKSHPKTVRAVLWLVVGFVLGLMAGCATTDHVYWCLRSAPGTGGPFCP